MINNYINQLEHLLKQPIKILIYLKDKYVDVSYDNLTYIKGNNKTLEFKVLDDKGEIISTFKLIQMIGCCGICVSTGVYVHNKYQNKGINTILNNFRIDVAKYLDYGLLLCTDVSNNTAEVKTLDKNGWKHIYNFENPRTKNNIKLDFKLLTNARQNVNW